MCSAADEHIMCICHFLTVTHHIICSITLCITLQSYYYSYSYGSGKSGKGKSGKGKSSKSSSKGGKSYGWYDSGKSGKSKSGKGSKGSSKGGKSKAAKSTGSYGYSMSMYYLPSCRRKTGLSYDTGSDFLEVAITPLITPESGATFNHFSYFGAADPKDGTCYEGDEPGVMRFTADGSVTPDGTMAECTYKACYEEACDPECCCQNIILIEVTD